MPPFSAERRLLKKILNLILINEYFTDLHQLLHTKTSHWKEGNCDKFITSLAKSFHPYNKFDYISRLLLLYAARDSFYSPGCVELLVFAFHFQGSAFQDLC